MGKYLVLPLRLKLSAYELTSWLDLYITTGETNLTLRRGSTVEFMMFERRLELPTNSVVWKSKK
jgi:hypothetical protein